MESSLALRTLAAALLSSLIAACAGTGSASSTSDVSGGGAAGAGGGSGGNAGAAGAAGGSGAPSTGGGAGSGGGGVGGSTGGSGGAGGSAGSSATGGSGTAGAGGFGQCSTSAPVGACLTMLPGATVYTCVDYVGSGYSVLAVMTTCGLNKYLATCPAGQSGYCEAGCGLPTEAGTYYYGVTGPTLDAYKATCVGGGGVWH